MRRFALIAALLLTAPGTATADGKTTTDPNLAVRAEKAQAADPKLAQKVSLEAKDQRLHSVVTELEKATGANLICGTNESDWRIRDIPVTVCVKDMPLGELLDLIAKATHTSFRSTPLESKGKDQWAHRLFRSKRDSDAVTEWLDAKDKADLAQVKWQWDALAALGAKPEAAAKEGYPPASVALGELFHALGLTARDHVLTNRYLSMTTAEPSISAQLRKWYRAEVTASGWDPSRATGLGPEDRVEAGFPFFPKGFGVAPLQMLTVTGATEGDPLRVTLPVYLFQRTECLEKASFPGLPPRPKPRNPYEEDVPDGNYLALRKDKAWDFALLAKKVKLTKPPEIEFPTCADKLLALSKAAGLTVICEDFVSHHFPFTDPLSGSYDSTSSFYDKERTVADHLKMFSRFRWFLDEEKKLLLGWADPWRFAHTNLVPESILAGLRKKLEGAGVELDDLVPILDLTQAQRNEWIYSSFSLAELARARCDGADTGAWRFYGHLAREDKALARSRDGLRLAKFDPQMVATFIRDSRDVPLGSGPQFETPGDPLTDPEQIPHLTMRVVETEAPRPKGETSPTTDKRYSYEMKLTLGDDTAIAYSCCLSHLSAVAFPIKKGPPVRPPALRVLDGGILYDR